MNEITQPARPAPRRWRAALAAAALVACAVTAAALITKQSPVPAPQAQPTPATATSSPATVDMHPAAFTVNRNSDGSITLTIYDLFDSAAATTALTDAGISGRVLNMNRDQCTATPGSQPNPTAPPGKPATITIRDTDYPAGGGIVVMVIATSKQPTDIWLAEKVYNHATDIPTCVNW